MSNPALVELLRRHPWSETGMLSRIMDHATLSKALQDTPCRLSQSEWGERWAPPGEGEASALHLVRVELVRGFLYWKFGPDAFLQAATPGKTCDGDLAWQGKAWRFFVDPGGIALEALPWVQSPPPEIHAERIILVRDPHRISMLRHWVEQFWQGSPVHIHQAPPVAWTLNSDARLETFDPVIRTVQPRNPRGHKQPSAKRTVSQLELSFPGTSIDGRLTSNALGRLLLTSGPWLVQYLERIGYLPLMTEEEISFLLRGDHSLRRIRCLEESKLIETKGGSYFLSPSGLELMAHAWGASLPDLKQRHPWPIRYDTHRRHWRYSVAGLTRFSEHTAMARQVSLTLTEGAERVFRSPWKVSVWPSSIVGCRISYRARMVGRAGGSEWDTVFADTLLDVTVDYGNQPRFRGELLVEVDRGTYSFTKLEDRFRKYQKLLLGKQMDSRELVFVFSNHDREQRALAWFREQGIKIWTVSVSRLELPANSDWWLVNPLLGKALPVERTGCWAPWRKIWKVSIEPDQMSWLLKINPQGGG